MNVTLCSENLHKTAKKIPHAMHKPPLANTHSAQTDIKPHNVRGHQ